MTRQRIEFTPNHTTKRGLITIGKVVSLILILLGIAVFILSIINNIDIIFGIGIILTGLVVGIFTYFYGRHVTTSTIWIEGAILYVQGGGLQQGYVRCLNLQNIKEIVYNPKTKEYNIIGKNDLAIYDVEHKRLQLVGTNTELRGVDDYTPSLVETLQRIIRVHLTISKKHV